MLLQTAEGDLDAAARELLDKPYSHFIAKAARREELNERHRSNAAITTGMNVVPSLMGADESNVDVDDIAESALRREFELSSRRPAPGMCMECIALRLRCFVSGFI